jgi:hypothetical protein
MYFINKRIYKLLIGMSCGFLLTKSLDLPLYYFPFSPYVRLCCIDNGYREAFGLVKDSIQEMLEDFYCKLKRVLIITSTFELCCRHRI